MTHLSIIGLGSMASALSGRALPAGNTVELIGRDPAKADAVAAGLDGATVGVAGDAPTGDVVVLAVPYLSAAAVLGRYGEALHGKVIIDLTNPITPDLTGFLTPQHSSGAQEIAKVAAGAYVVKAFNTLPADVLAAGSIDGQPVEVFLAGDDAHAKERVSTFVDSLGMRPLDTGTLSMARALEHLTLLQLGLITHSVKQASTFLRVSIPR